MNLINEPLYLGCFFEKPGVSIKFEVGSWLEQNNWLHEQGAVRPLNLGGSGGIPPQKILKSGSSEMLLFPADYGHQTEYKR